MKQNYCACQLRMESGGQIEFFWLPSPKTRMPALIGDVISCLFFSLAVVFAVLVDSWVTGVGQSNEGRFIKTTSALSTPTSFVQATDDLPPRLGESSPSVSLFWDRKIIRSRGRSKVRRTRAEIERERNELLEKTLREIDAIVAEFHKRLPRTEAKAIGSCYARYSSRFQCSIADQIRTIFEAALQLGIFIPREHVYFDTAVRGFRDRRPGLTALREATTRREFEAFLVFTTSRLFRRTYKAQQFVEEDLVEQGIRGIFLKSGIDTASGENWRMMFQVLTALDEAMVRTAGVHVRAAHEGLFIRGMVCTSLALGFTGEDVPGEFTKRNRPRQRIVVDVEAAKWIERIFEWYVIDGKSMCAIAREMNDDPDAPAPAKSITGYWSPALVRRHLMNPCYRGFWVYGATETKWSSGKDYAQQILREEPLKSGQFEDLRLIKDELWFAAQELIAHEKRRSGRRAKDGDRQTRPQLLREYFRCPDHQRQLIVGGQSGRIAFCPVCRAIHKDKRPLFSHLNRELAVRLTCETLAGLVRADEKLVADIITECQREIDAIQRPDPTVRNRLQAQVEKISRTIAFNRRNPGETDEEQAATERLLREFRGDQARIQAELAAYDAADDRILSCPSAETVLQMLTELGTILTAAASAQTDEELRVARRIIDELTGGHIDLYQMGERKAKRGWLQGRFTVRLLSFLVGRATGVRPSPTEDNLEVVINYCKPPEIEGLSERAKELYDKNMMNAQIAKHLGCSRSRVTALLKYWFTSRGLKMPDGRSRRSTLMTKHLEPPLYQGIADAVMERYLREELLGEIAVALGIDRNTVTAAVRWWHENRGLPVPDGRTRRKDLTEKTSRKSECRGEEQRSVPPADP